MRTLLSLLSFLLLTLLSNVQAQYTETLLRHNQKGHNFNEHTIRCERLPYSVRCREHKDFYFISPDYSDAHRPKDHHRDARYEKHYGNMTAQSIGDGWGEVLNRSCELIYEGFLALQSAINQEVSRIFNNTDTESLTVALRNFQEQQN